MTLTTLSEARCFGGRQLRFTHLSAACQCDMTFSVFLPAEAAAGQSLL